MAVLIHVDVLGEMALCVCVCLCVCKITDRQIKGKLVCVWTPVSRKD